jgi:hypothetical protein
MEKFFFNTLQLKDVDDKERIRDGKTKKVVDSGDRGQAGGG